MSNDAVLQIIQNTQPMEARPWPDPEAIPTTLAPVESFNLDLLPEIFKPWIGDIAERMQCPPDFPAVGAMVVLASVMGRKVGIRPRVRDNWLVIPNLWGGVIGRSGVMKTPALQEPMNILHQLEIEAKETYSIACQDFEASKMIAEERGKVFRQQIAVAIKKNTDAKAIALEAVKGDDTSAPVRKRFIINDSSVEKLGEILSENPNGVLLFRDELTGFLKTLDKPGAEGSRAFYLEAWNGSSRFTYDRIGRGTVDIESACVSILGGIQPGPLKSYLADTLNGGTGDDGLIQRFQLMVWPDIPKDWKDVDRWADSVSKTNVFNRMHHLHALDAKDFGAELDEVQSTIPFLKFTPEAQEAFTEWRNELEPRLRSQEEAPVLESHLSKYRSLVPSLALLIHLADIGCGMVSLSALEKACAWAEYLESHARRVYGTGMLAVYDTASTLYKRIKKGDVPNPFTVRDVYRKCWSGLDNPESVRLAAQILEGLNIIRSREVETGGRPTEIYEINPKLEGLRNG